MELNAQGNSWREVNSLIADELLPPVLDLLSFQRKSPLLAITPTCAVKAQTGEHIRQAILVNEHREPNTCRVDTLIFQETEQSLVRGVASTDQKALRWLRNAYRPLPIRERFVFAWLALESLAGTRTLDKICPACGHNAGQYSTSNRDVARGIVQRWQPEVQDATFRYWAGDLRNAVFHGGRVPNVRFLHDLQLASEKIIDAVEQHLNSRLNFDFQIRPVFVMGPDQIYYRHHFIEFCADNDQDEFAINFPSALRIEELIDGGHNPEQELNIHLLPWNETENW